MKMKEKDINNDWRLYRGQIDYLMGVKLRKSPYRHSYHTHCEFCWICIESENENKTKDKYVSQGYHTLDDSAHELWICDDCFEDFKALFQWNVVSH